MGSLPGSLLAFHVSFSNKQTLHSTEPHNLSLVANAEWSSPEWQSVACVICWCHCHDCSTEPWWHHQVCLLSDINEELGCKFEGSMDFSMGLFSKFWGQVNFCYRYILLKAGPWYLYFYRFFSSYDQHFFCWISVISKFTLCTPPLWVFINKSLTNRKKAMWKKTLL